MRRALAAGDPPTTSGPRYDLSQRSGRGVSSPTTIKADAAASGAGAEHEPAAADERQRAHGVVVQVDEVGHVSPAELQQRP